ncbi:hypothetical protein LCGC14_2442070 [marine sediment metagenome]|uniref:Thiamine pyrophosphate enzyme N-terminal TPP-binding domain-containing protein n=1 Tax=marine sediment metagenome TaxID=412755 RepID=A0A0F9DVQ3_9ZZZZ
MRAVDGIMECLKAEGVDAVFGIPGGASIPTYDALYDAGIRNILCRHEQGAGHAAEGYAKVSGKPGVALATSGPGATNLVTTLADAKLDSIPIVAITGQVGTPVIGTDAFQETPIVEVCRTVTKHHYLVTDVKDVARVFREAFHVATTGRKGPVLIDMPKDVQQAQIVPDYDAPMNLPGYKVNHRRARPEQIKQVALAYSLMSNFTAFLAVDSSRRTEGDQGEPFARLLPEHALLRLRSGEQLSRISKRNTCGGADQHRLAALSRSSLTRFQDAGKLLAESCLSERGSHSSSAGR